MITGVPMKIRREPSKPSGPPQVGFDEVVLDEQGQLFYRDKNGLVVPLRSYKLAVGQFVQDGGATAPTGSWILNELGAGGVWARTSSGIYTFTFTTAVLNATYGLAFGVIETSLVDTRFIRVSVTNATTLTVTTEDEAGNVGEGDCTFNVMVLNFAALVV